MRQLQLFTTAELATMRDRTKSRNYSPGRDEFRRDHQRRRAYGLARRHAASLWRAHHRSHPVPPAARPTVPRRDDHAPAASPSPRLASPLPQPASPLPQSASPPPQSASPPPQPMARDRSAHRAPHRAGLSRDQAVRPAEHPKTSRHRPPRAARPAANGIRGQYVAPSNDTPNRDPRPVGPATPPRLNPPGAAGTRSTRSPPASPGPARGRGHAPRTADGNAARHPCPARTGPAGPADSPIWTGPGGGHAPRR